MELEKIDKNISICGILGKPLDHTLSPVMHNAGFTASGLNFRYIPLEVSEEQLSDTIENLKERHFRGLNITIPYKSKVMQYLDSIDDLASKIGAVNTIVNNDGVLTVASMFINDEFDGTVTIGFKSSDLKNDLEFEIVEAMVSDIDGVDGAIEALKPTGIDVDDNSKKVLILGAGGSARAVCFGLARLGLSLVITNRTNEGAEQLAKELKRNTEASAVLLDEINEIIDEINIIINCTPVGMKGMNNYNNSSPISSELLRKNMIVFDIVYNPMETSLLRDAKEVGAKIIYGYEMLVRQGARSFELWTGKPAPMDVMREAVLRELNK